MISNADAGLGYGVVMPGDIVEVQIYGEPELSVKVRVSPSGDIPIPLLATFHVAGRTTTQAALDLELEYRQREILLAPHVLVLVQQFGLGITVIGKVRNPGIYPLTSKSRVLDLLALAGGPIDGSGHQINIYGGSPGSEARTVLWDPLFRQGSNLDLSLRPGQTIEVSACGIVYVGGNVMKPGGYPLCDSVRTTVSQVVALAGGAKSSTRNKECLLVHTDQSSKRVATKLDLKAIVEGRSPDPILLPDDILYIPQSALKAASKAALQAAVGFAAQAALYLH